MKNTNLNDTDGFCIACQGKGARVASRKFAGEKGTRGGAIKRRKPSKLRSVRDLSPSTRAHDSRKELNIIVTRNDELRIMLELHTLYT